MVSSVDDSAALKRAAARAPLPPPPESPVGATATFCREFHSPQDLHWPLHCRVVSPHPEHLYICLVLPEEEEAAERVMTRSAPRGGPRRRAGGGERKVRWNRRL